MQFNFKKKPAYYRAHALRDGTIWFASQCRKPSSKDNPRIDEDGIFQWFIDEDDSKHFTDWAKCLRYTSVATALNMKRIVRAQVEAKLDLILGRLNEISQRLDRLEKGRAE